MMARCSSRAVWLSLYFDFYLVPSLVGQTIGGCSSTTTATSAFAYELLRPPDVLPDHDCERVPPLHFHYLGDVPLTGRKLEMLRQASSAAELLNHEVVHFDGWYKRYELDYPDSVAKLFTQKESFLEREGSYSDALRVLLHSEEAMALRRAHATSHFNFTAAAVGGCPLGVLFWASMEYVACHMLHYRTIEDKCRPQRELLEDVLVPATREFDKRLEFGERAGLSRSRRYPRVLLKKSLPQPETVTISPLLYTRWPILHTLISSQVWRQPFFADIYFDKDVNCLRHPGDTTYQQRQDPRTGVKRDAALAIVTRRVEEAMLEDSVSEQEVEEDNDTNSTTSSSSGPTGRSGLELDRNHELKVRKESEFVAFYKNLVEVGSDNSEERQSSGSPDEAATTRYDRFRLAFNNYELRTSLHLFWQLTWTHNAMEFSFNEWISKRENFEKVGRECLWGYVVANQFKNYVCLQTETKCSEMFMPLVVKEAKKTHLPEPMTVPATRQ
eukprot:g9323.t1